MAKKKGSRTVYNEFFAKFKRKPGYIGSMLKNRAGESVFEFEFDLLKDVKDAKAYLSEESVRYNTNSVNPKRVTVKP